MAFNKARAIQEAEKSVSQRKFSQAIKQYVEIAKKNPKDLGLLNTIGDLCVREGNIHEALKLFHKLADSYVREGFTVKAIAIYKKIAKLDPNSVEPLLKLAELYSLQGLGREAREQYAQALEFCQNKNQNEKALEITRKIAALEPENTARLTRLAGYQERMGRKAEAVQAYLEPAEVALRRGETATAEPALKKALKLDATNSDVHLLRARLALEMQRPDEVEKILGSTPALKSNPAGRQLLLKAYLAAHNLRGAEGLVLEVFRADPSDFSPLASFSALCLEMGDVDVAVKSVAEVTDELIEQNNTGPLMTVLRQIWTERPQHFPTLQLICRICEATGDQYALPEIFEALGHAYVQAGQLDQAETLYRKLLERDAANEFWQTMLKQVIERQGREYVVASPTALSSIEMALAPENDAGADADPAATVEEALENSGLFSRYGLVGKAVAELEKALAAYPDQLEIHKRLLEVCQRSRPARAAQAATDLARLYRERDSPANVKMYEELAQYYGSLPPSEEFDETATGTETEALPLSTSEPEPAASAAAAPGASQQWDLSGEWEALKATTKSLTNEIESPLFNFEENQAEINFYLECGLLEEARAAIQALEEKFPQNPQVAALRRRVEDHVSAAGAVQEAVPTASREQSKLPTPTMPQASDLDEEASRD